MGSDIEEREESLRRYIRADGLREAKRYKEAERVFNEALELDPTNDLAVIGKAKVLRRMDRVEEAIAILTKLIDNNPQLARAVYNRGCYHALLGQPDKAIADLTRAIKLDSFYAEYVKTDEDFISLADHIGFKGLAIRAA